MTDLSLNTTPEVNLEMLIRVDVSRVFEAFVDPEITTRFWFDRSDGRLETGGQIRWYWDMFNVSGLVRVLEVVENERIHIEWGDPPDQSFVTWTFVAQPDKTTIVKINNNGFSGNGDEVVSKAMDSAGGFALVLANAKAWLEHGLELNLIADRHPSVN